LVAPRRPERSTSPLIPRSESPERVALRFEGKKVTYADLERRILLVAGALRRRWGVTSGDRVAYLGFNHPVVLELLYACARLGAVFVPINWRLAPPEHREILRDCAPKVLLVGRELRSQADEIGAGIETESSDAIEAPAPLDPAPAVESSAPVLLVYTSGATGRPARRCGAMVAAILASAAAVASARSRSAATRPGSRGAPPSASMVASTRYDSRSSA